MASKTTGKDEEEFARQHHLFYDMGDEFEAQLTPYLSSPDKTLLRYIANITDGTTEATFERTKLVPKAALERAKRDDGFLYNFAHSIAFSYNEEILQSGKYVCKECGKPAVMVLQSPTTSLTDDDPPLIHDIMAMPLCGGQDCDIKAKNSFLGLIENFQELMKQVKETTDVDVNVNLDRDLPKTCLHCGKVDDSLLKSARGVSVLSFAIEIVNNKRGRSTRKSVELQSRRRGAFLALIRVSECPTRTNDKQVSSSFM